MDSKHLDSGSHTSNNLFTYNETITTEVPVKDIFVVRESKYYEKEWFDLKRPVCFSNLTSAQKYVESKIDEILMNAKSKGEEEYNVERLASSMTWYYTMRTSSKKLVNRFEIYSTQLF